MTKGPRTIVALLAAVAVLLGLNLLSDPPAAEAQVEAGTTGSCCLPNGTCLSGGWTAAECASEGGTYLGDGTLCGGPGTLCFPEPVLVSVTVEQDPTGNPIDYRVFRAFSNGDVDMTWVQYTVDSCELLDQCGPVQVIPPPCPADVNDDLAVNVLDLIDVLLAFGEECPLPGG